MAGLVKGAYAGLILEGVVTDYYPVGHPRNRSGVEDEYAVKFSSSINQLPLTNCRLAQPVGYNDGYEAQLHVSSGKRVDGGTRTNEQAPLTATDGDVVLVQFIEGLVDRPIITHVISNPHSKWRTRRRDFKGRTVRQRHMGTTVLYDQNGNVIVSLDTDDISGTKAEDKSYTLQADGTQVIKATQDRVDVFGGEKAVAVVDEPESVEIVLSAEAFTLPIPPPVPDPENPPTTYIALTSPSGPVTAFGSVTLKGKIVKGSLKLYTD